MGCVAPSILGEPCPALPFALVSVDRVGGDHGCKGSQKEHVGSRCCRLRPSACLSCAPRDLQLSAQPNVRSPQPVQRPLGARARSHRTLELGAHALQLSPLVARLLLRTSEANLDRAYGVAVLATSNRTDRDASPEQAQRREHVNDDQTRLLFDGSHHTSCSPTASPSCLSAIRVGRASASRV